MFEFCSNIEFNVGILPAWHETHIPFEFGVDDDNFAATYSSDQNCERILFQIANRDRQSFKSTPPASAVFVSPFRLSTPVA